MALELKQSLSLRLSQQLVMTPQLQLAIKLLQLNRLELSDLVHQEMLENPMLEERHDGDAGELPAESGTSAQGSVESVDPTPPVEGTADAATEGGGLDIPWEAMAETYAYQPAGSTVRSGQDEAPNYEQILTRAETLHEHLMWQLQLSDLKPLERDIAARIIGDINEQGYLRPSTVMAPERLAPGDDAGDGEDAPRPAPETESRGALQIIAEELEVPVEWVDHVRHRLMRFDPTGVAALDLRECLLIQLDQLGYDDDDIPYLMVRDHLKDIESRQFKAIARQLKVSLEAVGEAMRIITQLEPKPGRAYSSGMGPETQYITPDIYVYKVGDDYSISLNEDGLPKLRISRFYRDKLLDTENRGAAKGYIRDKLRSATWLIRSIHQRQRTIYRVVESILERQRDFFDKGVEHLKPMVLQDVARDIGMHESTISRVTSNKYVHTPRGIFELKYFFNSSIRRTDGEDIASESVKNRIRQIISEEDSARPLSDAQIVKMLGDRKIKIARRTVAKYREMMGILPSSKRKQMF